MKHKILMTLALLITAVGGAWATDETPLLTIESTDYMSFTSGSKTFDDKVTITFSNSVENFGNNFGWYAVSPASLLTVAGTNGYTITSCKFYTKDGTATTGYTVEGESPSVYLSGAEVFTDVNQSVNIGSYGVNKIEVYGAAPAPDPNAVEVTTNAASEGATFTEATFAMPAFDATAEYELVRDMTYQVNAYVGTDPEAVYRHRVEKVDATTYWPVDITEDAQIIALFPVIDIIDAQNPKTLTYGTDYTLAIVDEQENEIDPADFDFAPGTYTVKVTGMGDYDGQIESLNKFELYFGYELTVGPGEFATFYKDEALTLDENETEAQLYTITAVGTETATATELTIAKANMPILVKNTSEEAKTILLIPTVDDADEVTVAPEFVGTLEATTIAASTEALNNYALNGKQFVFVKNAIEVGANKAWLSINTGVPSARITLVFGDATGVNGELRVENGEMATATWYDLNGRKLNGMPTKKGIYIMNGKKVVVK